MTSSPPPEAPHYNGNTLSPASPKPIHLPDLQNAPVLQNQTDPVFNLMSTHMAAPENVHAPNDFLQTQGPQETMQQPPPAPDQALMNGDRLHEMTSPESTSVDQAGSINAHPSSDIQPSTGLETNDDSTSSAHNLSQSFNQSYHASDQVLNADSHPVEIHAPQSEHHPITEQAAAPGLAHAKPSDSASSPGQGLNIETSNIQALLDNLIASASSAAPTENPNAGPTDSTSPISNQRSNPAEAQTPISALPTPAGLPPRPPPQDEPVLQSTYANAQTVHTYHENTTSNSPQEPLGHAQAPPQEASSYPPTNAIGTNGMPPPPSASFEQTAGDREYHAEPAPSQQSPQEAMPGPGTFALHSINPSSQSGFMAERDHAYQEFLREEAIYVADGTWDRFPQGSRLFVGNLFTEKVSKRDIWDIFSKFGKLAQISMKNAYGFVQFIDPASSSQAMLSEEGTELGGRKIHLEISKPQKNQRNNANAGNRDRGGPVRRSKSPDYSRGGQRPSSGYGGYERRGRDDYRPMRSPSPRGMRGYNNNNTNNNNSNRGTDRYYGGRRSRSPSPYGRNGRYRSRSPRGREVDDEPNLPIPRRNPAQIPDVQIIVIDESDRTFVGYIQQSFRDKGLRCDILQLPRGVALSAVIKRQIIEGVQAVVRIYRKSQVTGKIPLQVFDRSSGGNNVNFDDYEELDAIVAADVVKRSQQLAASAPYQPSHGYGQQPSHPPPLQLPQQSYAAPLPAQLQSANPTVQNAISTLDPETLQKLLGSLNQSSPINQQFQAPQQQSQQSPQDLAALLNSVARQTPQQQQGYQQPNAAPTPSQSYPPYAKQSQHPSYPAPPNPQPTPPSLANNPALAQLLGRFQAGGAGSPAGGQYQGQQPQPPQHGQQNVQDIMAQLAKYQR